MNNLQTPQRKHYQINELDDQKKQSNQNENSIKRMNKYKQIAFKCNYCNNQPDGIIYRPNNSLRNVYSCGKHATNLFIPFNNQIKQIKAIEIKKDQLQNTKTINANTNSITSNNPIPSTLLHLPSPQPFFQHLMSTVIHQFNNMKQQVMSNYYSLQQLSPNQSSLQFQFHGDQSYPYMIINNDNDMLMNHFVNRILKRRQEENLRIKQEKIVQRRRQLMQKITGKDKENVMKELDKTKICIRGIRSAECSPQNLKSTQYNNNNSSKYEYSPKKSFYSNQKTDYSLNIHTHLRPFTQKRVNKNELSSMI